MAYIEVKEGEKLFIEQHDEAYHFRSKDGWSIRATNETGDPLKEVYTLRNPQGEVEDTCSFIYTLLKPKDGSWKPVWLTYWMKHGRSRDQAVMWSPAHFTKGTVFRTAGLIAGGGEYTVNRVIQNGVTSFAIETTHIRDEGYFKGEATVLNICHVQEILYRPPGKAKVDHSDRNQDYLENPWRSNVVGLSYIMKKIKEHAILSGFGDYRSVDYNKCIKRLSAMGLVVAGGQRYGSFVKRKESLKFLKKNLHMVFVTVKSSQKEEKEDADRAMAWIDNKYESDLNGLYGDETRDEMLA